MTIQEIFTRDGIRFLREDLADLAIIYNTGELVGFDIMPFKKNPVLALNHKDYSLFSDHDGKSPIDFCKTPGSEYISLLRGQHFEKNLPAEGWIRGVISLEISLFSPGSEKRLKLLVI